MAGKEYGRKLRRKQTGLRVLTYRGTQAMFSSPFQFYPRSGPLRGSTRLTLCGTNFYLYPPGLVPEGTHQVTVGRSPCRLLPKGNSDLRYDWSLLFLSLMRVNQAAPLL